MRIEVVQRDATKIAVDVLALRYAQARFGLDALVFERLIAAGHTSDDLSPLPGEARLVPSPPGLLARKFLFVGTEPFEYQRVQPKARLGVPQCKHIHRYL